jgi:hypothetical protein
VSKTSPRERIERTFHVSFMPPGQAAELLDAYRAEVLAEAAEQPLPVWEAVYDSATFTPYLIGYCNDEIAARGAAEAWFRSRTEGVTGLGWRPDPVLAGGEWEQWLTLSQIEAGGMLLATDIVVRQRPATPTTTTQED